MSRCSLILLLSLLFPSLLWAQGPKLMVENADVTFAPIYQGEKVEQVYHLTNAGDQPLLIERVKSSCGCTAALVSSREIAPGESGEVRATFDSTRFRGPVVKTVYLYTNDPVRKVVQLYLRGTVRQEFELNVSRLVIGPLPAGGEGAGELIVTNRTDQPLKLYAVRTTAREVTASLPQQELLPGAALAIQVQARLTAESRDVNGYLLISTTSTRLPELRVPLQVRVAQGG